jgi:hypothetical protein
VQQLLVLASPLPGCKVCAQTRKPFGNFASRSHREQRHTLADGAIEISLGPPPIE